MFAEPPTASTMRAAITCRRCVRCVRHGSSLLPYATVFHYRRWVPQKHGNAGKHRETATMRYGAPRWCPAIMFRDDASPHPFSVFCRSAHSDIIPPCRILQSLSKIIVFCCLFGVSRLRKSYSIFHTRCVAGLLLKNEARPGATVEFAYRNSESPRCSRSLFSGDFRQSKPDLARGRGATQQARSVNGERTRQ